MKAPMKTGIEAENAKVLMKGIASHHCPESCLDRQQWEAGGRYESADENRQRVENERVLHERNSQPSWPRVMPRLSAMQWGSVDRGKHRPEIELRNHLNP